MPKTLLIRPALVLSLVLFQSVQVHSQGISPQADKVDYQSFLTEAEWTKCGENFQELLNQVNAEKEKEIQVWRDEATKALANDAGMALDGLAFYWIEKGIEASKSSIILKET